MPNGGLTFWSFFPCRKNELDAVNKLNERNIVLDGTILSVKKTGDKIFAWAEDRFAISWRTESESGYVWTGKFDLSTDTCGRGNFWIRKEKFADSKISRYVWTGAKGTYCHFDDVWQRYSCDNGKEICQKVRCTFRFFFLFISQTCGMLFLLTR